MSQIKVSGDPRAGMTMKDIRRFVELTKDSDDRTPVLGRTPSINVVHPLMEVACYE